MPTQAKEGQNGKDDTEKPGRRDVSGTIAKGGRIPGDERQGGSGGVRGYRKPAGRIRRMPDDRRSEEDETKCLRREETQNRNTAHIQIASPAGTRTAYGMEGWGMIQ